MLNVANIKKEKIAIIADDLTGANEIAALMLQERKKHLVLTDPPDNHTVAELWKSYDGLVVNLNSRNLSAQRAYDTVKNFLISTKTVRERLIYKKIDSTLRGNIGKEIDAVLDTGCAEIAVLVPALPEMGRLTAGGYHLVEQIPVGRTFYAENSRESFLPEILRMQATHLVGHVELQIVGSKPAAICEKLHNEYEKGKPIVICDCCTREDLRNIMEAIFDLRLNVLPIGSAGLFKELFLRREPASPCALIVCGSLNQRTRNQLTKLIAEEKTGYVEVNIDSILSNKREDQLKQLVLQGQNILNQGRDLIIATPEKDCKIPLKKREKTNMLKSPIAQFLAQLVKQFITKYPLAGVIVTGGDTATALLEYLHVKGIEVIEELEPLVPVSIMRGGVGNGKIVITKTGGFGTKDVFVKAVNYLDKRSKNN